MMDLDRSNQSGGPANDLHATLLKTLVVAGVVILLLVFWRIREALLLAFAACVLALPLHAGSKRVQGWTGLSYTWALVVVGFGLATLFALLFWLIGTQVGQQASDLTGRLTEAVRGLEQRFGFSVRDAVEGQSGSSIAGSLQGLLGQALSFGQALAGALSSLVIVLVGAFFLAASPSLYRTGLIKLFPKNQHGRVDDALGDVGSALLLWLKAQLISMVIVGFLFGIGAWIIGLPAPLALGLFAGITEFIPVAGPVLGAIPAVLLALGEGGSALLWTLLLFLGIQQIESNVIMPVVQRHMVEVPPALLLFALLAIGLVFGIVGVVIAGPLTVVLYVLVKKLYVRQTLGEQTSVPGEGG